MVRKDVNINPPFPDKPCVQPEWLTKKFRELGILSEDNKVLDVIREEKVISKSAAEVFASRIIYLEDDSKLPQTIVIKVCATFAPIVHVAREAWYMNQKNPEDFKSM